MRRPLTLWPLVLCLLILSIGGGFAGGIMMLIDPSGEMLGVADILPLLPVPNFILPGIFLAQQSYAVYLIHVPIIVFIAIALKDVDLGALPKFVLLSLIVVPVCYIVAWLIRKIPGVSRVI